MNRKTTLFAILIGLPLALSACGSTTEDRGLSGAGIGAAGGAVIGAVTGVGPVGGAVIGAAVGGAAGVLTDQNQVDLGKPAWRSGQSSSSSQQASATPGSSYPGSAYDITTVRNIQAGLQRLGYDPGQADGHYGSKTESAIRQYQRDNGLSIDGQPTSALWDQIRSRTQS